jgi:type IV pilus assembly protein PilW
MNNNTPQVSGRLSRGLSLIELMVALLISSIVVLGLVSLINAIGVANRTQDGLARMQENGRFAVQQIASDLRLAASQHCSKYDTKGSIEPLSPDLPYLDRARPTLTYFNAAATTGNGPGMGLLPGVGTLNGECGFQGAPGTCYDLSARFMLMGHECDATTCTPALNAANRGINLLGGAIPAMGAAATQRGIGADVLTVRYFNTMGALVEAQRFQRAADGPAEFDLVNDATVLAREGFDTMVANDPVWISDCSKSLMVRGTRVGGRTIRLTGNFDNELMPRAQSGVEVAGDGTDADARAFHVPTSLRTVSYYLRIKNDPKQPGRLISALMRKVDAGTPDQELVEGVERFDLLYGVRLPQGTRFLTAAQLDAAGPCDFEDPVACLWNAVQSVEVYLLVNTVDDVSPSGDDEFRYSWLNTGAPNAAGAFENPQVLGVLRNGLPAGRMLRREFRTTVSLRSNNY